MKAIIFDLYGTLLDPCWPHDAYRKFTKDYKLGEMGRNRARHIAMTKDLDFPGFARELLGRVEDTEIYESMLEEELASVRAFPNTYHTLQRLKDEGIKIGVISNLAAPFKRPFYELDIHSYVDHTVFSCDRNCMKPDRQIYRFSVYGLKEIPSDIWMVGDSPKNDVDGPQKIGIHGQLIDRTGRIANSIDSLEKIFQIRDQYMSTE